MASCVDGFAEEVVAGVTLEVGVKGGGAGAVAAALVEPSEWPVACCVDKPAEEVVVGIEEGGSGVAIAPQVEPSVWPVDGCVDGPAARAKAAAVVALLAEGRVLGAQVLAEFESTSSTCKGHGRRHTHTVEALCALHLRVEECVVSIQ